MNTTCERAMDMDGRERDVRECEWALEKGRQMMDDVVIIPFPTQHDLLVRLQVSQREDPKHDRLLFCVLVLARLLPLRSAEHGLENSIWPASTSHEP